jgi:hypothetical protein
MAGLSPRRPGSRLGQSMCDLLHTKWHWDKFFPEVFGFPLSISFHRGCPYIHIIWGWTISSLQAAVQTQSHPINMNNRYYRTFKPTKVGTQHSSESLCRTLLSGLYGVLFPRWVTEVTMLEVWASLLRPSSCHSFVARIFHINPILRNHKDNTPQFTI